MTDFAKFREAVVKDYIEAMSRRATMDCLRPERVLLWVAAACLVAAVGFLVLWAVLR